MEFDRLAGCRTLRAGCVLLVFAVALVGGADVRAQATSYDLVVTSPQAWAPEGSAPPHGVLVAPGRSATFSMRFTNLRSSVMERMLVIARTGSFPDARTQYRFSDPRGPVSCGEYLPISNPLLTGYGIPIGPLNPGETISCEWTVERLPAPAPQLQTDLALTVANFSDCLFTPPAPNSRCLGTHIRFGDLPDLSMVLQQITPIESGVSREVRVRMTVRNPTQDSIRPRAYGQCLISSDLDFRNDFPGACPRVWSAGSCLNGIGAYFGVDSIPARSAVSCELIVTTRTTFRDRQLIFFSPMQGESLRNAAGAYLLDPNPNNEQRALELGDPPIPVDLFGADRRGLLIVLAALLVLVGIPRLRGLR